MKKSICFAFVALFGVIQACAPSRFVEPLEAGELSIGGNIGGPVIKFGGPVPMPLSAVEIGYGLDTNLTLFGAWHTTAALFGNAQFDAGITYQFLAQKRYRPNLSVSSSFNVVYNFDNRSSRFWPVLDLNAYWNYGQRSNYFYAGVNNYFELKTTMANDQPQAHQWLFNPQIGHVVKGKNQRWQLTTEIKFLAPYIDNTYAFIPYASLTGSKGAAGFFIGYRWILGKNK